MSPALAVRIASYLLVLDGVAALLLAGLVGPAVAAVFTLALAASWWQERLRRRIRTPGLGAALGLVAALGSTVDLLYLADTILDGFVHLLLFLVLARLFTLRTLRDSRAVAFLAFFMLVASSASAFGVGFLFVFVVFLLLSTWMLLLQHVLSESEPAANRTVAGTSPHFARGLGLLGLAATASAATLLLTAVLFFVIPRVGLAALPLRSKLGMQVTGFSDRVELGSYGQIETDATIAMRVHIPEGIDAPDQIPNLRWRGIVFDDFDGRAWTVGRHEWLTFRRPLRQDFRLAMFKGRGLFLTQEFYLDPLGTDIIFAAPRVLSVQARTPEMRVDDMGSLSILSPSARLNYRVQSELEGALPSSVGDAWGFARSDDPTLGRYLQLPKLPPRIRALAREVAGGSRTPYEAALRLNAFLSREFGYTLALERRTKLDPLEEFLFVRRSGNCEYFAASLAVMLRTLGIPARVVGGFQRGEWNPYGRYFTVRLRDAHSWVEAYFPSAGWITLDPSPRLLGDVPPGALGLYLDSLRMRWYRYVINWSLRDQVEVAVTIRRQAGSWKPWLASMRDWGGPPGRTTAGIVLVAAALVAVGWLWRRPAAPARAVSRMPRFYARALRVLARRGLRPAPGETAREFCARVALAAPACAGPFARLTADYERARFGSAALGVGDLAALEASLALLERPAEVPGVGPPAVVPPAPPR